MKKKILLGLAMAATALLLAGCGGASSDKKVTVGGKNYTEQDVLVEIVKQTIEGNSDIKVTAKPFLGGTNVVATAMDRGDLDIYVEYTGTSLLHILKLPLESDSEKAYEIVKKAYGEQKKITWLKPLGFNNTYTLSMRREHAESLGVEKISDLVPLAPTLTFACEAEFMERPDGYPGLKATYNLEFDKVSSMDVGLMYGAVRDGQVDVIDAFATDGRIPAFDLKVLEDDKNFFPPYDAAPIIRQDTLAKYPELEERLNRLAGKLNDEEMAKLNAQVDLEKKVPRDVVAQWLKAQGIVK
jgi:Periplasmic glycine betaine/choline-binding (lipo)protein of an ABC-type transport system (osmoprotectant binding protein)